MMLQGKGATTWVGDSMLRRVHSMLQVVFRQSALLKRAQGHISTPVAEKGLLAYDTYAAVYRKCQALTKRQAGAILPQELGPQDDTPTEDEEMAHILWQLRSGPDAVDAAQLEALKQQREEPAAAQDDCLGDADVTEPAALGQVRTQYALVAVVLAADQSLHCWGFWGGMGCLTSSSVHGLTSSSVQ
jgi:hypothetical protein